MGLMGFLMHKSAKSSIKKTIACYEQFTPDHRAGGIFYIWLLRGLNLAKLKGDVDTNIPIYYYLKGAEVALTDLTSGFRGKNSNFFNAANHHFYTNLAVSYPNEGYRPLVRNMWEIIFQDYTCMQEIICELQAVLDAPQLQEWIANNDVSASELAENPRLIMPHFLVPEHKLSVTLMENEKIANSILNR